MANIFSRLTERIADAWDPTRRIIAESQADGALALAIDVSGYPEPPPAPVVIPPLSPEPPAATRIIARPPVVDRFPIQIGTNLTGQYLSSAYRLCTTGWRYQFVDLINELLEFDPHARAVTRQRVIPVGGGRIEINRARLPPNDPDEELADDIARDFDQQLHNIPNLSQALCQLNWGVVYGLAGAETEWDRTDGWDIAGLSNIHSRRLNYPNPADWELYIWDQGSVGPGFSYMGPTTGVYGLRVSSVPGKFIVHAPALNGDYPTRDGEGRYMGMYMLLKRMVVRACAQDFERTIRPWVIGYFNRDLDGNDGKTPIATPEDEAALDSAIRALGAGSLNGATLPNTVKIEILKAISNLNAEQFVSFLNREMSKCMLGQSFTTEPGANGNLTTAEIAKVGTLEVLRYDARALADTLERDLATPWLRLNYPKATRRLLPRITIMVDELPDPKNVMEIATKGTAIDMPIDVDKLAEMTGMPVVAADDTKARRTRAVVGGKGVTPQGGEDPNEPGYQAGGDESNGSADGASNKTAKANKPNGKGKEPAAAEA